MVKIDPESKSVVVSLKHNPEMYVSMLKSLCGILASLDEDNINGVEITEVATLLGELLPDFDDMKELVKG